MKPFHQTKPWRKVSAEHKKLRCYDCGATKDITSGHILAASRYKLFRLWKFNLCYQCMPCNLKLGTRTNWKHWKAPILWSAYMMIKLLCWAAGLVFTITLTLLLIYFYLDCWGGNHCTITHHIQDYALDGYRGIRDFLTDAMRFLSSIAG